MVHLNAPVMWLLCESSIHYTEALTQDTPRPAYIIMMDADVLAPNMHQTIINHHANWTETSVV